MTGLRVYRGRRVFALFLVLLAAVSLALLLAMPFVMSDPILALLLMGLPLLFAAAVCAASAFGILASRVEIGPETVSIRAPLRRLLPVPRAHGITSTWGELRAVRRRVEIYRTRLPPTFVAVPFPVEVFAVVADHDTALLAGRSIGREAEIVQEIARRAGLAIEDDGEVPASLLGLVLGRVPPWPASEPGARA